MDPAIDTGARTTATSAAEGRLKVDVGGMKRAKKNRMQKIVKKYKKDGKGGLQLPGLMQPSMGITPTPSTYTPQQQSALGSMGSSVPGQPAPTAGTPPVGGPSGPMMSSPGALATPTNPGGLLTSKPHKTKATRGFLKPHKAKMQKLKSNLRGFKTMPPPKF